MIMSFAELKFQKSTKKMPKNVSTTKTPSIHRWFIFTKINMVNIVTMITVSISECNIILESILLNMCSKFRWGKQ